MKYRKKVLAQMPKCYALAMFKGADVPSFVAGVEKEGPIRRFALNGDLLETVAEGPGGVMTLTQVPGRNDQLLATCEFYSPNFGGDSARIVSYTRSEAGWKCSTVCDLPYVHRFGIVQAQDGRSWLLACTIKSSCRQVKEDWSKPGAVYAAPLDESLENYNETHQLALHTLAGTQLQNHGFWISPHKDFALIATAAGVFRYIPPAYEGADWDITCLIVHPTSDIVMADFDGDGKAEILTFSAFHGEELAIWHEGAVEDSYECVWKNPQPLKFLHALWAGELGGVTCAVIGHRKAERDLLRVWFEDDRYHLECIDHDFGPANCWAYSTDQAEYVIAANRETDELALYEVIPDEMA